MNELENPGVHFHVLGGTISCVEKVTQSVSGDAIIELGPASNVVKRIVKNDIDPKTIIHAEPWSYSEAKELKDSSQYEIPDLVSIVRTIRELLSESKKHLLICMGTDGAAAVMHALAEGIPTSLLGNRALMGVVSQKHASPNRPRGHKGKFYRDDCEPVSNLTNAIFLLAKREEFRGRLALCCHGAVYSPRGLVKLDTEKDDPFYSRFHRSAAADMSNPVPEWRLKNFDERYHHLPRGDGSDYTAVDGVEEWGLGPSANYRNFKKWMQNLLPPTTQDPQTLHGIVLTAPGKGDVRKKDIDTLACGINRAAKQGIPVTIVPRPVMSRVLKWSQPSDDKDRVYIGSLELLADKLGGEHGNVIPGRNMLPDEAGFVMGRAVALATQNGLTDGGIVQYTKDYFTKYFDFLQTGSK